MKKNKPLDDYEKTRKYYIKQDNDIYLKLKPYLNAAIQNATFLGTFNENEPGKAMCEMELLFQEKELENIFIYKTKPRKISGLKNL